MSVKYICDKCGKEFKHDIFKETYHEEKYELGNGEVIKAYISMSFWGENEDGGRSYGDYCYECAGEIKKKYIKDFVEKCAKKFL